MIPSCTVVEDLCKGVSKSAHLFENERKCQKKSFKNDGTEKTDFSSYISVNKSFLLSNNPIDFEKGHTNYIAKPRLPK